MGRSRAAKFHFGRILNWDGKTHNGALHEPVRRAGAATAACRVISFYCLAQEEVQTRMHFEGIRANAA